MNSVLTDTRSDSPRTVHTTRLPILEITGIAALAAIIAIHTSELSGKVEETAYLGFGYILLIASSSSRPCCSHSVTPGDGSSEA